MDKTIEEFVDIYVYWNTKKDRQGILTRIEALIQSAVSAERERCAILADELIFDDMEEQYGGVPVNNIVFSVQAIIAKAIRED